MEIFEESCVEPTNTRCRWKRLIRETINTF